MHNNLSTYVEALNATDNPAVERTLLYAIHNTPGLDRSELGVTGLSGLARFSAAEVRTMKASVAALIAATSRDQALLDTIARRDTRKTVQRGLGRNPHLSAETVEYIRNKPKHEANSVPEFTANHWNLEELYDSSSFAASDGTPVLVLGWRTILYQGTTEQHAEWVRRTEWMLTIAYALKQGATWDEYLDLIEVLPASSDRIYYLLMTLNEQKQVDWSAKAWERVLKWDAGADLTATRPIPSRGSYTLHEGTRADWGKHLLARARHPHTRKLVLVHIGYTAAADPEFAELLAGEEAYHLLTDSRYVIPAQFERASKRHQALFARAVDHFLDKPVDFVAMDNLPIAALHILQQNYTVAYPEVLRYLDAYSDELRNFVGSDRDGDPRWYNTLSAIRAHVSLLAQIGLRPDADQADVERMLYVLRGLGDTEYAADTVPKHLLLAAYGDPSQGEAQKLMLRTYPAGEVRREGYDALTIGHVFRLYELEYPDASEEEYQVLFDMINDWDGSLGELVDTVHALRS